MQAISHLNDSMQSLENTSPINLGVSVAVAAGILDALTELFKQKYPQIQIKLLICHTSDIEAAMQNNELDLAIVSGEIHNPMIETHSIIQDYQICVCRSDHPFAKRKHVTLDELCQENFIMLLNTRWTRITFENYVHDRGLSLNIICECSNVGLVKEQVLKGRGITIISARSVEKELLSGQLSVIRCTPCMWERPFILAYRKQKYLSQPLKDFIHIAKTYTDNTVLDLI